MLPRISNISTINGGGVSFDQVIGVNFDQVIGVSFDQVIEITRFFSQNSIIDHLSICEHRFSIPITLVSYVI